MTSQKADTPEPTGLPQPVAPEVTRRQPPVPEETSQDDPMPGADLPGD